MRTIFLSLLLLITASITVFAQVHIIPEPVEMKVLDGEFNITPELQIIYSEDELEKSAQYLNNLLYVTHWLDYPVSKATSTPAKDFIALKLNPSGSFENDEAYSLIVTTSGVTIEAATSAGIFYGIQSLRQMLPVQIEQTDPSLIPQDTKWSIPTAEIYDHPRFEYRGLHLDVARHFFPVEFVKRYIDLMSAYKYNRFHWHLTEDQGWRIEIKQYPKLQEIAAWRDSTLIGHYGTNKYDNVPHGGYYTQDEIKEVVAYAAERHITIIPEIEMPGHSSAALAAYPELGCYEKEYHVASTWGVFEDIYCPKEETFEFLENVLDEVMELFPSTYIHIGGDEAPKKQWDESPIAQQVIQREGLADSHELQSYFITRMEKYLNTHGRQIIGWDEILEGGLAPQATVMSWRGEKGGIEAAKMHHDVIMTPWDTNYLDHYQAEEETEPLAIGGFTTVEDLYNYEPVPAELSPEEAKYILGAQGNVWTEYMHSGEKVEYMVYPRAIALSEVLWTPAEQKNWDQFFQRLQIIFHRLDIQGVNYAPHYKE